MKNVITRKDFRVRYRTIHNQKTTEILVIRDLTSNGADRAASRERHAEELIAKKTKNRKEEEEE